MSKKNKSYVTGYRYYFSVLAGICRGPVDEIFLIKSDERYMFNGNYRASLDATGNDPYQPLGYAEGASAARPPGSIVDNEKLVISMPELYGGDKSEGGIDGVLSVYFGAKDQIISALDYIKDVMTGQAGLLLSDLRGVVTTFFDGEVCANNPYPKAWSYRVRRALKGWDGPVWYPERAIINLVDDGLPTYQISSSTSGSIYDYTTTSSTIYSGDTALSGGESTGSGTVATITTTYQGGIAETQVYTGTGGTVSSYLVPLQYNQIKAMNPAHIVYECATNRDWGRGLDRDLIDNISFSDAANTLYTEKFGLCCKWSRTEDIDVFVQMVLDHIGGVVYTDKVTGLLCLRLIRGGYDPALLPVFGYNNGLLEVTSCESPAGDVVANEIIAKYRSPVLDTDKEARAQNIASINSLGCVFSTTRDYSAVPVSQLALRLAQRDLKIFSGGWKVVEAKLDRRAYSLNPGDVIKINAPERGLNDIILRVATVSEGEVEEAEISVTAAADIFGLPIVPMRESQASEFMDVNRLPMAITIQYADEATFRDAYIMNGGDIPGIETMGPRIGYMAARPSASSLNYRLQTSLSHTLTPSIDYQDAATGAFSLMSKLVSNIGMYDNVFQIRGEIMPGRVAIGSVLLIVGVYTTTSPPEFVRLDAITRNPVTGVVELTVARGCIDTNARAHEVRFDVRVWAYDDTAIADPREYLQGDYLVARAFNHTTRGDSTVAYPIYNILNWRARCPYPAADFRLNGFPRDATPAQEGLLTFTWKHRDRTLIQDQLVGEFESGGSREANSWYNFLIEGTDLIDPSRRRLSSRFSSAYLTGGITGDSLTYSPAQILADNIGEGPMTVSIICIRATDGSGFGRFMSKTWAQISFYYGAEPDTGVSGDGFNFDFDRTFDGVAV